MTKIKFGTSGWRGILADDFTFANARLVCQGIADFLKEEGDTSQGVVVAYDTRANLSCPTMASRMASEI